MRIRAALKEIRMYFALVCLFTRTSLAGMIDSSWVLKHDNSNQSRSFLDTMRLVELQDVTLVGQVPKPMPAL